jgi:hypothetical protein
MVMSSRRKTLVRITSLALLLLAAVEPQQAAARALRRSRSSSSSRETGWAGALALSAPAGREEAGARGRSGSAVRRVRLQQQAVALLAAPLITMTQQQQIIQWPGMMAVQGRTLEQGLGQVAKEQQMVTGTVGYTVGTAAGTQGDSGPSGPREEAGGSGRSGSGWLHGWRLLQPLLLPQLRWTPDV